VKLDHAWIAGHIPHQGTMCLLDEVLSWDLQRIACRSRSHCAPDNPLRAHGRLGAACAIEYAAQAVAIHGALLQCPPSSGSDFGMLTSARRVEFAVTRLDDLSAELLVSAQRLHSDAASALYAFSLHDGERLLAQGRLTVLHTAPAGLNPQGAPGAPVVSNASGASGASGAPGGAPPGERA
jgi:predicted hotdog family 3-hydroxylacyl-ACP dehydratase